MGGAGEAYMGKWLHPEDARIRQAKAEYQEALMQIKSLESGRRRRAKAKVAQSDRIYFEKIFPMPDGSDIAVLPEGKVELTTSGSLKAEAKAGLRVKLWSLDLEVAHFNMDMPPDGDSIGPALDDAKRKADGLGK